jgi:hypothetical protein
MVRFGMKRVESSPPFSDLIRHKKTPEASGVFLLINVRFICVLHTQLKPCPS